MKSARTAPLVVESRGRSKAAAAAQRAVDRAQGGRALAPGP